MITAHLVRLAGCMAIDAIVRAVQLPVGEPAHIHRAGEVSLPICKSNMQISMCEFPYMKEIHPCAIKMFSD